MKNWWLKFGCFLTGHNYYLVNASSESSARCVKKYLSAIIIVSILWGAIGFIFFQRYLKLGNVGAAISGCIMVIIVVQIERQIILAEGKNLFGRRFRMLIAFIMAIIGSVITDQIVFKDDIEKKQISNIQLEVNRTLPYKTSQINKDISGLEHLINKKEQERLNLMTEIAAKPVILVTSSERKNYTVRRTNADGNSKDSLVGRTEINTQEMPNPRADILPDLNILLKDLRAQKSIKQNQLITIRDDLEKDLKSKRGFLDELSVLFDILFSKFSALFIWLCFFLLFFAIELFVLVSKNSDESNDYDKLVSHQKNIRIKILEKLAIEKGDIF